MLKGIERNNYIRLLFGSSGELAPLLHPGCECETRCRLQKILTNIEPDYPLCTFRSHLHGIGAFTTAEIDHYFVFDLREEVAAEQDGQLGFAFIRSPAAAIGRVGKHSVKNTVLKVGQHRYRGQDCGYVVACERAACSGTCSVSW